MTRSYLTESFERRSEIAAKAAPTLSFHCLEELRVRLRVLHLVQQEFDGGELVKIIRVEGLNAR